jgi:hypothetical protein
MKSTVRILAMAVIALSLVSLIMGIVFLQQGFSKQSWIVDTMKEEKITFEIDGTETVIDNARKAQIAGDTVREHRHSIAPTYGDLLGGAQFNPEDPRQLTYAQALNLENYLYLAVATFGLITVVLASGASMIVTGLALGLTGFALLKVSGNR